MIIPTHASRNPTTVLVKIVLGKIKEHAQELSSFLEKRVPSGHNVSGDEIVFEADSEVKTRTLKTYLKRFIHNMKLGERFRVRVAKDTLEIVEVKGGESREEASS